MNKDEAAAVSWWLNPENAQARRELERRHPELGGWLQMVEKRVAEAEGQIIMTSESNANRKFK